MNLTIDTSAVDFMLAAVRETFAPLASNPYVDVKVILIEKGVLVYVETRDKSDVVHLHACMEMTFEREWKYCAVINHATDEPSFNCSVDTFIGEALRWAGCPTTTRRAA
jgi:hypothetical protein